MANVEGAMNAVLVKAYPVGQTLHYGKGAGGEPTASAVIADLIDVVRLCEADPTHRPPHLAFHPDQISQSPVLSIEDIESSYYLRLPVINEAGVLADITRILAEEHISIDALLQKKPQALEQTADIILLTNKTHEKNLNRALDQFKHLASVRSEIVKLRVETLD